MTRIDGKLFSTRLIFSFLRFKLFLELSDTELLKVGLSVRLVLMTAINFEDYRC